MRKLVNLILFFFLVCYFSTGCSPKLSDTDQIKQTMLNFLRTYNNFDLDSSSMYSSSNTKTYLEFLKEEEESGIDYSFYEDNVKASYEIDEIAILTESTAKCSCKQIYTLPDTTEVDKAIFYLVKEKGVWLVEIDLDNAVDNGDLELDTLDNGEYSVIDTLVLGEEGYNSHEDRDDSLILTEEFNVVEGA